MTTTTRPTRADTLTRRLLAAGVVAGPLFVVTGGLQALTRDGFDLGHQPLSLLSLGDLGWIQISNFLVAGLLSLAFAVGVARCLTDGPGAVWAPRLLAVFGIGLVLGGAFLPDPALRYPVGTPDGYPTSVSVHGLLHAVAPPLSFLALVAVCFVLARRFAAQGHRWAALGSRSVAFACLVLVVPVGPGASWRIFLGVALGFGWIAAVALTLLRATR